MNSNKLKRCLSAILGVLLPLALVAVSVFFAVLSCGCVANKASHQSGIVFYGDTRGRFGIGYGETEDLPLGCVYYRRVYQSSPAFLWQAPGTNLTDTTTYWDTRGMSTNAVDSVTPPALPRGPLVQPAPAKAASPSTPTPSP